MHKLNNGIHACVFPTRCGTRWIAERLFNNRLLDYAAPTHEFVVDEYDSSLQNIMFVRNPFTRIASAYFHEIRKIGYMTFESFLISLIPKPFE